VQFNEVKFINLSPKGGSFLDPTENMRFWLTFFIGYVFAHFVSIWHEEGIIQQLKAWSFRMWKNLVDTQSNSDTIACWSSITFFFIHPVHLFIFCMFSSTHGSQCDSEYNYIPRYIIEDKSNDTIHEIGTLCISSCSEILGDYDACFMPMNR
jgi:hypothetical protein